MMRSWLLACAVWLVVSVASAQATAPDAEARLRFEAGQLAFHDGRYEDALADFRRSYELSHRPALLYNIGQCADRLRRDHEALEAFTAYLHEAGDDAANAQEVWARVTALETAIDRGAPAAPPPEPVPLETVPLEAAPPEAVDTRSPPAGVPSDTSAGGDPTAGIALASAGVAVLAAGVIMLVLGEIDRDHVEHPAPMSAWSDISDAASRVPTLEGVGVGAIAVGVVACGVGIALAITSGGSRTEVRATATGLTIAGTF